MAVHNFNYTFEFVSLKAVLMDDTKIVNQATCKISAVDQTGSSKTGSSLETVYFCPYDRAKSLPDSSFIDLDSLTEAKVVEWVQKVYEDKSSLDALFTFLVYGADVLNPPEEGG